MKLAILTCMLTTANLFGFFSGEDSLVERIANSTSCSKGEKGRLYLNPEKLIPSDEGLFLEVDGDYLLLPCVFSSMEGCYVEKARLSSKVTKKCHYCDWERVSYVFKCGNPSCPSNQPDFTNDRKPVPQKKQGER